MTILADLKKFCFTLLFVISIAQVGWAADPRPLSPSGSVRSFMLGLSFNFIHSLRSLPNTELNRIKSVLHKNDILLLPIGKMATPKDIDDLVSFVASKFPDQRLYIFPYASRASLMFDPLAWSGIPAANSIKGILPSTIAKLDGVLIDHEPDSYCHTLEERERSIPDNVRFNNIICANPKFPKMSGPLWARGFEASAEFLIPLVRITNYRTRAVLDNLNMNDKTIYVGLIPSGTALNFEYYSSARLLTTVGGDGQIIQTQGACKNSPLVFEGEAKKIDLEYKTEASRLLQLGKNTRMLFRSNIGMQVSIGDAEDISKRPDSAMVTVDRAVQCVRRMANYKISTVLLFHMRTEYTVEVMQKMNLLRTY